MAIKITKPPHVYMTDDGSEVSLFLTDNKGKERELVFTRDMFESVVRNSVAIVVEAKNRKADSRGVEIVHGIETQGFRVVPILEEQKILVTFVADTGIDHTFAMPALQGPQFRADMSAAEERCKKARPATRH